MNQQLIDAFYTHNTFNDIADVAGLSNKQFEQILIETIKLHYKPTATTQPKEIESTNTIEQKEIESTNTELSDEQLEFVRMAITGENIFLTSSAGFGKSFCISEAVQQLRKRFDTNPDLPSRIAITASTGKAASLIGGRTIHSYLGIGLAKQSADELYDRLVTTRRLKSKYHELKNVKTIIIDEISMVNDILLNKISCYLELIKKVNKPFGGVQMIFVGDLHQLAPVEGKYFIEAVSYKNALPIVIKLTKCFRQDDPVFQQILSEARIGQLTKESFDILLQQNDINHDKFPGMKPTRICSTNREVDAINQKELNKLTTEKKTYRIIPIATNMRKIEAAAKLEGIVEQVELAIDAQIIITTNVSMGGGRVIANGTQGTIISMYEDHINARLIGWSSDVKIGFQKLLDPECIDEDSNPIYLFEYLPVRLGWGSTIHKSQGATYNLLDIDMSKIFAAGQGYVAISRVRSLDGLKLTGLKRNAFIADKRIIEFYSKQ
jgi:ATP-dependent exoDNAse (exonuclease V) alpha subunit